MKPCLQITYGILLMKKPFRKSERKLSFVRCDVMKFDSSKWIESKSIFELSNQTNEMTLTMTGSRERKKSTTRKKTFHITHNHLARLHSFHLQSTSLFIHFHFRIKPIRVYHIMCDIDFTLQQIVARCC